MKNKIYTDSQGCFHRLDGPARTRYHINEWWIHGKRYYDIHEYTKDIKSKISPTKYFEFLLKYNQEDFRRDIREELVIAMANDIQTEIDNQIIESIIKAATHGTDK